ncbi:type II toxin-antitoxin system VapC family toxin [Roseicella aquatilis]|uniref:Ribonuclease VapC n=1 Tax=Roseicella aquatilis TaxID=2527868 RepID=A0A4R4DVK3_9PROT|nr:type II toxin-antitoxin system VapC family toxin [Roseicella aquatilis]TCZ64503.1 type II toxin-antitoxin system VapC family toxin [Roseicella aquatilis]
MILDSSAVLVILRAEAGQREFAAAVVDADRRAISAANRLEAAIVIDSRGNDLARADFETFFEEYGVEIIPVTPALARLARAAYVTYGKGRHPAALNFGDCFAYALAQEPGEPLLFRGNDFPRNDVTPALPAERR